MKHVEIKGKEIAIINLDGKYYAINDRCGHMNAPLSKGEIRNVHGKDIVTCPLHFATFDIVTGKNHPSQRCLLRLWIWQLSPNLCKMLLLKPHR
jgi:nitrite reductase/ring-hydroxylating ferredoxin subunit